MLRTIIALSFVLACGFLLVILSCALFNNFLPLIPTLMFLLAPVPNAIGNKINSATDYMDESSASIDAGRWVTGFLVASGFAMSIQLAHVGLIRDTAAVMGIVGGVLIYGSIIVYGQFFSSSGEDF